MEVAQVRAWQNQLLAEKAIKALKNNGFEAYYFETRQEAAAKAMEFVEAGMKVGFGGSTTAKEMDLIEKVRRAGATAIVHSEAKNLEEKLELMRQEQLCDLFITGTNAFTMEGTLLNIDAIGNRVGAMIFGPKQVLVVTGINKLVNNAEEAQERMKRFACPTNNKKLGYENPCTKVGFCVNCNTESRICRAYVELKKRPMYTPTTILIIGEELGL